MKEVPIRLGRDPPSSLSIESLLAHGPSLRSLALHLAADEAGAEDLVQETWMVALRREPPVRAEPDHWLRGVLRNIFRTRQRAETRRRRREELAARPEAARDSSAEIVERAEVIRRIVGLVLELEPIYREAVLLRYFDDLSPSEIAGRLGLSVDTVHTRIRRALEKLRRSLDESHGGDRAAWTSLFLPLAGLRRAPMPGPAAPPPHPLTGSGRSILSRMARSAALRALIIGGSSMTLKTIVPVTAAVAALLGLAAASLLPERREPSAARPTVPAETAPEVAHAPPPELEEPVVEARVVPPGTEASPPGEKGLVSGIVRGLGGEAIAGAAVEAVRVVKHPTSGVKGHESEAKDRTGEAGEFRFELLKPGSYRVRAVSPEHRPGQTEEVELDLGESLEVEVELATGLTLEGIVLDPAGRPVVGASVWSARAPDHNGPNFFIGGEDEVQWAADDLKTITGARGEFRLSRLPSGNRRLFIRHPDWAPREHGPVAAGSRGIEVRLHPGASIEGQVLDFTGLPGSGALVRASVRDHHWLPECMRADFRAKTDVRGAFRLETVPRSVLRVEVELPDGRKETTYVDVPEAGDLSGIEMVVPAAAVVRGRVVSLAGEPLPGTEVTLRKRTERGGEAGALASADGSFEIVGIEAGIRCAISVRSAGRPQLETLPFVIEPDMDLGELVLEEGIAVAGIVVSASGAALPRSRVYVSSFRHDHWNCCEREGRTDAEGRFTFDGLRPGTYRVESAADGFRRAASVEFTLGSDEASPEVRVVLGEGGVVTGRVLSAAGLPESCAKVVWRWHEQEARAFSDVEGRFTIAGLGDEALELQASRGARASRVFSARAGDSLDLVLGHRPRLAGSVRDRGTAEPVGEFQVFVAAGPNRSRGKGETFVEPSGRFLLEDLEPGDHTIRIFAKGYLLHETKMALEPGMGASLHAELERSAVISGRLREPGGQPVSGARIFPVSEAEAERERASGTTTTFMTAPDGVTTATSFDVGFPDEAISGKDGLFALEGLPKGTAILRVEHPLYFTRVIRGIEVSSEGVLELGDIRLEAGAALEGLVLNSRGKPVRGGTVHIQRMGPDGPVDTMVYTPIGKDGIYRKSGLRPGRAWISVFGNDATGREVELEAETTLRADFRIPRED